ETALEIIAGFAEVSDFSVQNAEVVEDPRHWFRITRHFKSAEAVCVKCRGLGVVSAHARQHAAVLFDHSKQPRVAGLSRQRGSLGVEALRLLVLAPSLRHRPQTIECLCLGLLRTD